MTKQNQGPNLRGGMQLKPMKRTGRLITQAAGAELLVYDETIHKACCLNDVAAAVWTACDGSQSVRSIAHAATAALQRPVSEDVVLFTLAELRRDGLLVPDALPDALPSPPRRELIRKIGFGAAMALPVVTAIMAPKAAQAYTGCFNCDAKPSQPAQKRTDPDQNDPYGNPAPKQPWE